MGLLPKDFNKTNGTAMKKLQKIFEKPLTSRKLHITQKTNTCLRIKIIHGINRRMKFGWILEHVKEIQLRSKILHLKKKAFEQIVLSVLTYGYETWASKIEITRKLKVTL